MEVLEKGQCWSWSKKVRCTGKGNGGCGCGSLLQVSDKDVYITAHYCYDGSVDYYYTIWCPVCNVETDIKEEDIPSKVKHMAFEEYRKNNDVSRSYYIRKDLKDRGIIN